ncbi:ureidoglycolate lyase [Salinisphaera sp. Q1T1-3]|uniref:ureidoglycolate lyase n=1 Tax=Salinisphaera sp. Q1T1-3 TaxID=2321229 RepID=UPI000E740A54|nr:ureidoglycolate lyase [Salinisphaera sp. Q1T1-3]RJS91737.1 ureidoglycolate lyase [Salinisphaera sp. Q1T1-3]
MARAAQRSAPVRRLVAEPLTARGFAPFGDVIASSGPAVEINQGKGRRFADLACLDLDTEDGRPAISRVACRAETAPVPLRVMERHPLGTQVFVPLDGQHYLVVVAPAGEAPAADAFRAFIAAGHQGINYHRGVWHHPMIALDTDCEFLEVHRSGPGANCDEIPVPVPITVDVPAPHPVSS